MRKEKFRILAATAVLLCYVCFIPAAGAADAQAEKISMASFKAGSGWYIMAQTMAKLIKSDLPDGSQVDVLPYSGGVGNPMLLDKGKADLALGFPVETGLAINGEPPYKTKIPQVRVLVSGLDTYWYVFALRADLPITSLDELKAKKYPLRLAVMPRGSSGEWDTRKVLEAYGITFEDIISWGGKVNHVSFPTAVEMMKDGQADAFGQVCTPGHPAWMQLATSTKLRFMPISKEIADKFSTDYGFTPSILPKGTFPGVTEDVRVLGFATLLMTTDNLPADIAYMITKAICTNKEELVMAYKGANVFDIQKSAGTSLPLHPGAVRFYREAGILK